MSTVIVYKNSEGKNIVLWPTNEVTLQYTAEKDVPPGLPYRFVNSAAIPSTREDRDAMDFDFSNPDGVGLDYGSGSNNVVVGYTEKEEPIVLMKDASDAAGIPVLRVRGIE